MSYKKYIAFFIKIYAVAMVGLAVVGAFRAYTPVPYIDMWPGCVGAYVSFLDGHWFAWLEPYVEHPNTLAKIFFFADLYFFHGMGWSLLVANYCIVAIGALILCLFIRTRNENAAPEATIATLYAFVIGSAFYWTQWENLTWGFQISLFLGQILPLCALFFLYRAMRPSGSRLAFSLACLFGFACVGTMGSGILILPCLLAATLFVRQSTARRVCLAILSILGVCLYAYIKSAATANQFYPSLLSDILADKPLLPRLLYVLGFLGNPFCSVVGRGHFGDLAAVAAGIVFLALVLIAVRRLLKSRDPFYAALLGYLGFVMLSGVAVALARYGYGKPTTSRYGTTPLLGWLTLFALYSPEVLAWVRARKGKSALLVVILPLMMLAGQTSALKSWHKELYRRDVEMVGMALGANLQQPGAPNPWIRSVIDARVRGLTIFSIPPYKDIVATYRTVLPPAAYTRGEGALTTMRSVPGDRRFLRVNGWLCDAATGRVPGFVRFVDESGTVIGFALADSPDAIASGSDKEKARRAFFDGFVLSEALGQRIALVGADPLCRVTADLSWRLFPADPLP